MAIDANCYINRIDFLLFNCSPTAEKNMRMLNLGCGSTFHKDWVNVDFIDHGGKVLAYDLRLGIPFADCSFDVVYHSHVLEHMPKAWGEFFIAECYRVLRPGGLLRVVVPDLENIARVYLESLDASRKGEHGASERHQWMLIELLDQLTRSYGGGEMLNYWKQNPMPQQDFVLQRLGKEAEQSIAHACGLPPIKPKTALPPINTSFLLSGEVHKWMYDAVSLAALLEQNNFVDVQQVAHNESCFSKITHYGLDTTIKGQVRKPDSFFMEAKKPSEARDISLRVVMFSTTDSGGASIAALRLHQALCDIGASSHMYVAQKQFFQDRVHIIPSKPNPIGGGITFDGYQAESSVRKELIAYRQQLHQATSAYTNRSKGAEYFSMPGQCVPLEHVPLLEDAHILHWHWVSGMLDASLDVEYLKGKKIVWTLHDMNAFTGGCHYSNGCRKFETMCSACLELGSDQENDLAFETWRARMRTYCKLNIHVVAPSTWLADEAKKSALLGKFPVHVIPYAQPLHIFKPLQRQSIRSQLGLKQDSLALLFASQSLTNTRKGSIYLVQLLHALAKNPLKERITVFLLGNNAAPEFTNAGIDVQCLGLIDDATQMAALYNAADAVIVPSLEDNQPNVICESLGCGTPVVAFANGGIGEMIRHKETGFLVESKSVDGLLQGVLWVDSVRDDPLVRRLCRAHALEWWEPTRGAQKYLDLYKSILQR